MKNKSMLKILFLSLVLSSCGLIERFKTPEEPTDSKESTGSSEDLTSTPAAETSSDATDDLFSKTMDESSATSAETAKTDAPGNISNIDPDLKSLEDEFSSAGPNNTKIKESSEAPVLVEEALPEIKTEIEVPAYSEAGQIKTYRVQRGETLMQISFKLYGDISKWKDIKNMNANKLTNNTSLKQNTELKYRAPATPFVWNPAGTPYLIKNGETLGTISNTVYATPKKWKAIWQNNKPLIKNPNVIYAGFTLYYTNGGMANYVQPKAAQPKKEIVARELARAAEANENAVEEVMVAEKTSVPAVVTPQEETQMDEAIQTLSAPERQVEAKDGEIDLINNVSVPHDPEVAPDIDEELQTL